MKGVLKNKDSIRSLVDPLDIMTRVYSSIGTKLKFRYEFTDEFVYLSGADSDRSLFVNYKLNVSKVFEDYSVVEKDIGIYDTAQFIKLLKKYASNLYPMDAKVMVDYDVNKFKFVCGRDVDYFYTCDPSGITKYPHDFDDSKLKKLSAFKLTGINLKKILSNMSIYTDQNSVVFSAKPDEEVTVQVYDGERPNQHEAVVVLDGIVSEEPFRISFVKNKLMSVLESSDDFGVIFYTNGKSSLGRFLIDRDSYSISLTLAPRKEK